MTILPRDVAIGVYLYTDDGPREIIVKRRNREITAWEIYAARNHLPATAATLAMTYQAWRAMKTAGDTAEQFDAWADRVIEVFPCDMEGIRLYARDGVLYRDGDALDPEDGIEGDPTRPVAE